MTDYGKKYRRQLIREAIEFGQNQRIKPISADEMSNYIADRINAATSVFNRPFSGYIENGQVKITYEVTS